MAIPDEQTRQAYGDRLAELCADAYRAVAPAKLIAMLDAG